MDGSRDALDVCAIAVHLPYFRIEQCAPARLHIVLLLCVEPLVLRGKSFRSFQSRILQRTENQ